MSDLPSGIVAAESLVDFKPPQEKIKNKGDEGKKPSPKKSKNSRKRKWDKSDAKKDMSKGKSKNYHNKKPPPKMMVTSFVMVLTWLRTTQRNMKLPLQRLYVIVNKAEKVEFYKGLMYICCSINDNAVMALVDFVATHDFIRVETAKRFGLVLSLSDSMMKTVNAEASSSHGVARDAMLWVDK